jgi:hypothetical protein
MSKIQRECCNWCMWLGPVNKNGTMRKHRPPFDDGTNHGARKIQDMSQPPCEGSNKPFATFGDANVAGERMAALIDAAMPKPRFVVSDVGTAGFAVCDMMTGMVVATKSSRYAAHDKAYRLENEAQAAL